MLIYETVCLTFIQKKNYSISYCQVKKLPEVVSFQFRLKNACKFFEVCLKLVGPVSLLKRFWNKFQSQIKSALSNLRFWVSQNRYTLWRTNLLFKPFFFTFYNTIVNNRAIF